MMIQRIQTLYLLIVAALMMVVWFAPLAWFAGGGEAFRLYAFALRDFDGQAVHSTAYLGILAVLAGILPLIAALLFRRRLLQVRLCVVEAVLLVGVGVMEGIYCFLSRRAFSEVDLGAWGLRPALVLPGVCLLFVWLAARAIFRDEMLVRAADRIR